jgi:hypothetical protein
VNKIENKKTSHTLLHFSGYVMENKNNLLTSKKSKILMISAMEKIQQER